MVVIDDAGSNSGNKAPLVTTATASNFGGGGSAVVFTLPGANFAIGSAGVQHVAAFDAPTTGSGYSFGSTQTLSGTATNGQILAQGTPAQMTAVGTVTIVNAGVGGTNGCTGPLTSTKQISFAGSTGMQFVPTIFGNQLTAASISTASGISSGIIIRRQRHLQHRWHLHRNPARMRLYHPADRQDHLSGYAGAAI